MIRIRSGHKLIIRRLKMRKEFRQNIINTLDEQRKLISSSTSEATLLYPDAGKALKNVKTGKVYPSFICLSMKEKASDFIEIDK